MPVAGGSIVCICAAASSGAADRLKTAGRSAALGAATSAQVCQHPVFTGDAMDASLPTGKEIGELR